jgi:hypothetical protein
MRNSSGSLVIVIKTKAREIFTITDVVFKTNIPAAVSHNKFY